MNIDNYFDKIEQYLEGVLPLEEEQAFEQEIEANEELRQAVENHLMANDAIELLIEDSLRAELKEMRVAKKITPTVQVQPAKKKATIMRRLMRPLAIAASVLLLIGAFTFVWTGNRYSNEGMVNKYFEDYTISDNQIRGGNVATSLRQGLEDYKNQNFQEAIAFFNTVPQGNGRFGEAQFYKGLSHYRLNQFNEALSAFQNTANSKDTRFNEKAQFYMLSIYLTQDQLGEDFQTLLQEMTEDEEHSYHQQAVEIQEDLNSNWRKWFVE